MLAAAAVGPFGGQLAVTADADRYPALSSLSGSSDLQQSAKKDRKYTNGKLALKFEKIANIDKKFEFHLLRVVNSRTW